MDFSRFATLTPLPSTSSCGLSAQLCPERYVPLAANKSSDNSMVEAAMLLTAASGGMTEACVRSVVIRAASQEAPELCLV